jgi:hypothetical protein
MISLSQYLKKDGRFVISIQGIGKAIKFPKAIVGLVINIKTRHIGGGEGNDRLSLQLHQIGFQIVFHQSSRRTPISQNQGAFVPNLGRELIFGLRPT